MSRPTPRSAVTRRLPVLGVAVLVLGALTWPLLLTHSGFAPGDWEHHLWLMWHQSISIKSNHFPSFFLNSDYSVFYPVYAFYGGTLYAVTGLLSLALGGAPVSAYVLVYLLDFTAAFGGWYWLGRMAGVGRWLAMIPGLIFISSAYYVLVAYPQGDWPELTGVSMIPVMLAAGLSVLRADRLRIGAGIALAASVALFFGAHNLTMLLALTTLSITALLVCVCVPDARRTLTRRGVARVAGVTVPAALVSSWYLLPLLVYHSSARISTEYLQDREELKENAWLVGVKHLFTFSRTAAPGMSLPTLAIVWVLAGIVILPRGARDRMWVRLLLICSGMALVIGIAMTHPGLILALPRLYTQIQYSYRLEAYVLLGLCGAILAALVLAGGGSRCPPGSATGRSARVWLWMAVPVCAVSLGGAVQQLGSLEYPGQDRYVTLEHFGEVVTGDNRDYDDVSEPVIAGRSLATIDIPAESVHADRASFVTHLRPGTLIATNIGGGPNLVALTGAKAVGVDSETGNMVIEVGSGQGAVTGRAGSAPVAGASAAGETVTVSTADGAPVVLGRLLTFVGLAILALQLLLLPAYQRLARLARARDAAPGDARGAR
jgi:hypothetical protein